MSIIVIVKDNNYQLFFYLFKFILLTY